VVVQRSLRGTDDVGRALTAKRKSEVEQGRYQFWALVKAVHRLVSDERGSVKNLADETFKAAQWALTSEAAASLTQMAARQAKGDNELSRQVRRRQDLVGEWQVRDKLLIAALSLPPEKRDPTAEQEHRARLGEINAEVTKLDRMLKEKFPEYAALANPEPLSLADVQANLGANEALVLFLDTPELQPISEETFIWVVTKASMRWVRSDLGTQSLTREVAALRCGLDDTLWNDADRSNRCVELVKAHRYDGIGFVSALPFDLERAHALYKRLLGPVEDVIKDKSLLIVPSGALTSLPFNALVTRPPTTKIPSNPAEYRSAAWLGVQQPVTVLPSVASLKALRAHAKYTRLSKVYLGVGNPLLDGPDDDYSKEAEVARQWQRCSTAPSGWLQVSSARGRRSILGLKTVIPGNQANIEHIRKQTPLPESADELCRIAGALGVPESWQPRDRNQREASLRNTKPSGLPHRSLCHSWCARR
jgi:hypothetical protein